MTARSRLPQASVTLMGSGTMEWIRERDRVIHVSAGEPTWHSTCLQQNLYCVGSKAEERCLVSNWKLGHVTGKMVSGQDGSIHSKDDIARLAAALTRASLPMHYKVVLEGEKLS